MSMPLTRATTASDAEEADEDDEDVEDCCPQPVAIGSTRSASAATVETAVRRGRSSTGAGYVNRGSFNEIMALSLKKIMRARRPRHVAGQSPNRHPFAISARGREFEKKVRKLAN